MEGGRGCVGALMYSDIKMPNGSENMMGNDKRVRAVLFQSDFVLKSTEETLLLSSKHRWKSGQVIVNQVSKKHAVFT
jgi:hypothetical protein